MKWLIILLLILLVFVLYSRYTKLEKVIRQLLNKRKYKLPDEIIIDTVKLNAAQLGEVEPWFISNGYSLVRQFKIPSKTHLHLYRKGDSPFNVINLLTKGEEAAAAMTQAEIELDGVNFEDIGDSFIVLFPEQSILLRTGTNIFRPCKKSTSNRRSGKNIDHKSNKYRSSSKNSSDESNIRRSPLQSSTSRNCLTISSTKFDDYIGPNIEITQPVLPGNVHVAVIDSKASFAAISNFELPLDPASPYQQYLNNNAFDGTQLDQVDEHGTFMVSLVAKEYKGNKSLQISNYPFHDGDAGHLMELLAAIYAAVEAGAEIINLSLGYSSELAHPLLRRALVFAHTRNVLVICAAGNINSDNDTSPYWPANFGMLENVITVGAVNSAGTPWKDDESNGTNFGSRVNLSTEGVESTGYTDDDTQKLLTGTSCSAAVLSGIAATIKSQNPGFSALELKTKLHDMIGDGSGVFAAPYLNA